MPLFVFFEAPFLDLKIRIARVDSECSAAGGAEENQTGSFSSGLFNTPQELQVLCFILHQKLHQFLLLFEMSQPPCVKHDLVPVCRVQRALECRKLALASLLSPGIPGYKGI